ncbi:MAG: UDP-2,3-diacylglucosamine diphosphatase [Pseudomonadota bacterium]
MGDTLFISDLHLDEEQPAITRGLLDFLVREAPRADALYVLGDLFEAWVGDDHDTPLARTVIAAFRAFADGGRPLYFMHGNRDFLLGDDFAARAGGRILAENTLVDLYGTRAVLAHGDGLCTDDHEYQKFRAMVRNPDWLSGARAMPLELRLALAAKLRSESKMRNANKPDNIMDVNAGAVADLLRRSGADVLIHGHTHRPAVHEVELGERRAKRYVLGDWRPDRGWCLRAGRDGIELESFAI